MEIKSLVLRKFYYTRTVFDVEDDLFILAGEPDPTRPAEILVTMPVLDLEDATQVLVFMVGKIQEHGYTLCTSKTRGFRITEGYLIEAVSIQAKLDDGQLYDLRSREVQQITG
jgi:hypothetical protein